MKRNLSQERLGMINISNEGYEMKVIQYNNYHDIIIEFQDKYKAKICTQWKEFDKGKIKNPYHKSVFNVGYFGQGKYKSKDENGKDTKAYKEWYYMLERCYDPYKLNKCPTYINVYVCNEWLCFQNFAEWFYKNYYEIKNEKMRLDKDILIKNNNIYSPNSCCFVPERINLLFIRSKNKRGEYPIGVTYRKRDNVLNVQCSIINKEGKRKNKYLGQFSTNESLQAFLVYKEFKENYIKEVADEYKNLIPQKLYEALYRYEVEIND